MSPYHLSIIGLVIDMVGAYFLAIEAIGLDRLKNLRETRFRRIYKLANPDVRAEGGSVQIQVPSVVASNGCLRWIIGGNGCLVAAGVLGAVTLAVIVLAMRELGMDVLAWPRNLIGPAAPLETFFRAILLIPLQLGLFVVTGGMVYTIFVALLHAPVSFLEYSEQQHAGGTAGLLGFLLITLGFLLQLISSVLQQRAGVGS